MTDKDKSKDCIRECLPEKRVTMHSCTLCVIASAINAAWIFCIAIIIGIPLILLVLIILLILVIPSGVVILLSKCSSNTKLHLNEVVNDVLKYEIHSDTNATKILRMTWDGIENFPDYPKEARSVANSQNAANHVAIEFQESLGGTKII